MGLALAGRLFPPTLPEISLVEEVNGVSEILALDLRESIVSSLNSRPKQDHTVTLELYTLELWEESHCFLQDRHSGEIILGES